MNNIRKYIRFLIEDAVMVSHSQEPSNGDLVINNNPGCKHFKSQGVVLNIMPIDDDVGKTIKYIVINKGKNFSPGDVLEKTLDQLVLGDIDD